MEMDSKPNWIDIGKCPIWKTLGIIECENCSTKLHCWPDSEIPNVEMGQLEVGRQGKKGG